MSCIASPSRSQSSNLVSPVSWASLGRAEGVCVCAADSMRLSDCKLSSARTSAAPHLTLLSTKDLQGTSTRVSL